MLTIQINKSFNFIFHVFIILVALSQDINKNMPTKNSTSTSCILCDNQFNTRNKGLKRTNVFSHIQRRSYTISDALKVLDIVVSPLKVTQNFCCEPCTVRIRDLYDANLLLKESKDAVEELVSPESYVGAKQVIGEQSTFTTPRKGLKRLPIDNFTPIKRRFVSPKSAKASCKTYNKSIMKKRSKVCLTL